MIRARFTIFHRTLRTPVTLCGARSQCKRDRHPDDEEEKRKDQIGWRPTMPLGMTEGPIDVTPGAWIIDKDHAGDGQSAKHIERDQSLSCASC